MFEPVVQQPGRVTAGVGLPQANEMDPAHVSHVDETIPLQALVGEGVVQLRLLVGAEALDDDLEVVVEGERSLLPVHEDLDIHAGNSVPGARGPRPHGKWMTWRGT